MPVSASTLLIAAAVLWVALLARPRLRVLVFGFWILTAAFGTEGSVAALIMFGPTTLAEHFGWGRWGRTRRGRQRRVLRDGQVMPRGWKPGRDPLRSAPEWMRAEVFARDGHRCAYCGDGGPGSVLHADHIIPWSQGGATTPGNLETLCRKCNLWKGTRSDEWAREEYLRVTGFYPVTPPLHERLSLAA